MIANRTEPPVATAVEIVSVSGQELAAISVPNVDSPAEPAAGSRQLHDGPRAEKRLQLDPRETTFGDGAARTRLDNQGARQSSLARASNCRRGQAEPSGESADLSAALEL